MANIPATHRQPVTPDHRYFVVRGRLWRMANPALNDAIRQKLVSELMDARRKIAAAGRASDDAMKRDARLAVDRAKQALGERGTVWWHDGAPDYNRRMVRNTPYADWYEAQQTGESWREAVPAVPQKLGQEDDPCGST